MKLNANKCGKNATLLKLSDSITYKQKTLQLWRVFLLFTLQLYHSNLGAGTNAGKEAHVSYILIKNNPERVEF